MFAITKITLFFLLSTIIEPLHSMNTESLEKFKPIEKTLYAAQYLSEIVQAYSSIEQTNTLKRIDQLVKKEPHFLNVCLHYYLLTESHLDTFAATNINHWINLKDRTQAHLQAFSYFLEQVTSLPLSELETWTTEELTHKYLEITCKLLNFLDPEVRKIINDILQERLP